MKDQKKYLERGVSSTKQDVHMACKGQHPGEHPGAFCKILSSVFPERDSRIRHLMHADGVGSKGILAYLIWKETGSYKAFENMAWDAIVMNIDDMACTGALGPFIISNNINRNRGLIPREVLLAVMEGFYEVQRVLNLMDVKIVLGGGETADVGDVVRTLSLDCTAYTQMFEHEVIDFSNISDNDVILGFYSGGKAVWESKENSGIGCNGLTAARHDCLSKHYRNYVETYDPNMPTNLIYSGSSRLSDPFCLQPEGRIAQHTMTMGEALASPTRTHLPVLMAAFKEVGPTDIKGIVHNTGGGQTKCLRFGQNIHYVIDNLFDPPAIFKRIQKECEYSLKHMFKMFNMGHRMEMIVDVDAVDKITGVSRRLGVEAQVVGYCEKMDETHPNKLTIRHDGQDLKYRL